MNTYQIAVALILGAAQAAGDRCLALAMSGGGSNGAWEAGVIWGFAHYAPNPEDFYYDVVTGVSAGAINTAALAGWDPADLVQMSEWLSDTWANLHNPDIYTTWPEGIIRPLWTEKGILDNSNAVPFLQSILDQPQFSAGFKRKVTLASVDVNTGDYFLMNNTNLDFYTDLSHAAMSSGSIPAVFPPQNFKGRILMDGGTVWNVNIDSAIKWCQELGYQESQITIDVFNCGTNNMNVKQVSTTATGNHKRSKEIHDYYWGTSEIATHMRAYPQVNWRYFVQERSGLGGTSELDFTNSTTWPIQVIGRQEAQEALDYGPGYGFDRVPIDEKLPTFYDSLHYWLDSIF